MTDNEIIKALKCCNRISGSCEVCPLYCGTASCIKILTLNALDLISRQKAENERLLQKLQQAKSEAIKGFAELLCKGKVENDPVVIAVKAELKEMAEVKENVCIK